MRFVAASDRAARAVEYYFQRYGDLELQRRMVKDRRRTEAFALAIREVVKKTDIVLDVGTGTGLLAMLAARAGAKRVYAIDQAEVTQTAANLIKANGLEKQIKVFRGFAQDLQLDEPVQLLISEWLGNFAFVEAMLDDVLAVRDKNLAPGGRMLPSHVELLLAPVDEPLLYHQDGPGAWRDEVFGLDLSSLEALELKQGRGIQTRVEPGALLAPGGSLFELDLTKASADDPFREGKLHFVMKRDGCLNGFVGWFSSRLSPGIVLDTGPHLPETHWSQTYLAFPSKTVRRGQMLEVSYAIERDPVERRHLRVELKLGRQRQSYVLE